MMWFNRPGPYLLTFQSGNKDKSEHDSPETNNINRDDVNYDDLNHIEDTDKNDIVRGSGFSYADISNNKQENTNTTAEIDVSQNR